ncbi:MAG: ABC transporter permease [Muribaculum sp.]|nr:ABC transporter permease [Muribaculum sp.]
MDRKLLIQMRNEWRSNLWLAVELLIVSVVMWYICDYIYVRLANYYDERGFEIDHCYLLDFAELTPQSPDYVAYETQEEADADKMELLDRLSRRPEIEAAAYSNNSRPYTGSNSGIDVMVDTLSSSGYVIRRWVTPDYLRIYRYRGVNGETPEELVEILRRGEILPSRSVLDNYGKDKMIELAGHEAYLDHDTVAPWKIGTVLEQIRYQDWEEWNSTRTVVLRMDNLGYANELSVRVKDNMDNNFAETLMEAADKELRVGNFYIRDVKSLSDLRENFQRSSTITIRNYLTGMGFLMLNVFLGLLGTFWFRTQQRVREIAIRKVSGATRRAVFSRFISEGVLILSLVTIPAIAIDFWIAKSGLNSWLNGEFLQWDRLLVCALVSYLIILIMIVIGISVPANRAMKTEPAQALHDE